MGVDLYGIQVVTPDQVECTGIGDFGRLYLLVQMLTRVSGC